MGAGFVVCDIADPDQLRNAVDVGAGAPGLDILVNNAGIFPTTGPLTAVTDEFVHRMLDVNVRAQFSATRDAAARMPNGGSIVNLASIAALGGGANISAYAASKAAVIALTQGGRQRARTRRHPRQRDRTGGHRHTRRAGAARATPRRRDRHRQPDRGEPGRAARACRITSPAPRCSSRPISPSSCPGTCSSSTVAPPHDRARRVRGDAHVPGDAPPLARPGRRGTDRTGHHRGDVGTEPGQLAGTRLHRRDRPGEEARDRRRHRGGDGRAGRCDGAARSDAIA